MPAVVNLGINSARFSRHSKSMSPKNSEPPLDRAGGSPQKLNLGCGTILVAIAIIALLGMFLPHESRRPIAMPAVAAKPVTKASAKREPWPDEPPRANAKAARAGCRRRPSRAR